MKVADVYRRYTEQLELVPRDAPIDEVIDRVAKDHGSRSVFVVDDDQTLIGIIRMADILNRVGARHIGWRGITPAGEVLATQAHHMMIEPLGVEPGDDVDDALRLAVQFHIEDVPVLENGRIVGQVDCFELLEGSRNLT